LTHFLSMFFIERPRNAAFVFWLVGKSVSS
jgi:hypothetical protein